MSEGKWDHRGYLGDKEFYKNVVRIAVPVSLQQLITVGINLMDTIMLSSMGDAQLSASALAGQFINLFQIFCMGIGMGASVLTSRFWGTRKGCAKPSPSCFASVWPLPRCLPWPL